MAAADLPMRAPRGRGLGALTPSGRAIVPAAWALYDFANTIFSYAIVSTAIGLWLTDASRFGQATGQLVQGVAIATSVGLNAIVSPVLGAMSDRGGRRLPFLLFFTILTIVPAAIIGPTPAALGAVLFAIANSVTRRHSSTTTRRWRRSASPQRAASCQASALVSVTSGRSSSPRS